MKNRIKTGLFVLIVLFSVIGVIETKVPWAESREMDEVPVKGMVTMLDLGAKSCIPCKMMTPILEKLENVCKEKAAIVFIDVWKDRKPAVRFGIRSIPTQIFFDEEGKEVYRHVGFMSENAIRTQLRKMGIECA